MVRIRQHLLSFTCTHIQDNKIQYIHRNIFQVNKFCIYSNICSKYLIALYLRNLTLTLLFNNAMYLGNMN